MNKISKFITEIKSQFSDLDDEPNEFPCFICPEKFTLPNEERNFLTHIFMQHRLVIADASKIASFKSYVRYWSIKFCSEPLSKYCTTVLLNCTPDGQKSENEQYFLLSDCLSEDKTLRSELHRAKLEWVLSVQEKERNDKTFKRCCIFCRTHICSRISYVNHLAEKHNYQLGKPENLVFIDKLLDIIEEKLVKCKCPFCDKTFVNRTVLILHMRKKFHKRINPYNSNFDKFYIINYLETDQKWRNNKSKDILDEVEDNNDNDRIIFNDDDEEQENTWSDWIDESTKITCLFCKYQNNTFNDVLYHMIVMHNFDLENITNDKDFYEKIKIVNYIRHQIYSSRCIFCDVKENNIQDHMQKQNHFKLPQSKIWLESQFYFPKYENDPFLYNLDINNKDIENEENIEEDFTQKLNISEAI